MILRRAVAVHPSSPDGWFTRAFGGLASLTGLAITPESAESVAAVFACVRIISESAASLPCHLMQTLQNGGKERARKHPVYRILHDRPNPWQTPFEFFEMFVGHCALRGSGYAQKLYRNDGQLNAVIPLHPDRLHARLDEGNGDVVFDYRPMRGDPRTFGLDDLFRITTHSADSITGRSPIAIAREAVGLAMATERHGARFFSNMAQPGGLLTHPGKLGKEGRERLRRDWQETYSGVENSHGVAVLEEGLTWTQVGLTNKDAQFLEARRFQLEEIARLYRVPLHMLADLERATFSNIEQQGLDVVTYMLLPWLIRMEQAIYRDLLQPDEQENGYFAQFLVDALLKGDIATRYTAYATARQWGWLCTDEIRDMENRNPLPEGKGQIYLQPSNMVEAGAEPSPPVPPPGFPPRLPPGKTPTNQQDNNNEDQQQEDAQQGQLAALLREPLHRLARREAQVVRDAFKREGMVAVLQCYDGAKDAMVKALGPVIEPAAGIYARGTLPPGSLELIQALVAQFADRYVAAARAAWSVSRNMTTSRLEERIRALEQQMPTQMAAELAKGLSRLIAGARILEPAA